MNNQALYNAALAGVIGGSLQPNAHTDAAFYTHYIVECVAFATAVDTEIDPLPGGASVAQAAHITAICEALWQGRFPGSPLAADPGYVKVARTVAAVFSKANAATFSTGGSDVHTVKAVCLVNVANLASYTVAASATFNDNVAMVEGDTILLVGQTTATQNGPYVVGAVTTGHAPLTRPTWWRGGDTLPIGSQVRLSGLGDVFANTTWESMRATGTSFIVGTNDPEMYPLSLTGTATLTGGAVDVAAPIRSALSGVSIVRTTPTTATATIMYAVNGQPTPGPGVTGTVHLFATVAAGTLNNADASVLTYTITNQRKSLS